MLTLGNTSISSVSHAHIDTGTGDLFYHFGTLISPIERVFGRNTDNFYLRGRLYLLRGCNLRGRIMGSSSSRTRIAPNKSPPTISSPSSPNRGDVNQSKILLTELH